MPQQHVPPWQNVAYIATLAQKLFPESPVQITRVPEGVSTYVYQIVTEHGAFFLRVLPEADASFAPEVAVHNQLRHLGVKVPAVVYFDPYHELLQRSIMVTTEIKGISVSQSNHLSPEARERVVIAAGRDLALINSLPVAGFGWVERKRTDAEHLRAEYAIFRAFVLSHWTEDLAYLSRHGLTGAELEELEQVVGRYAAWLDVAEASLAHGDFDTTAIYQENGKYTGIIDFGEIRGTSRWYDLGHFHLRDSEQLPHRLLPALVRGYGEVSALPADHLERIQFTSLLINIRLLARSLRKRSGNPYTRHQFEVLRSDLAALR
jgi:aminoglycoside phosphotransferase (APT) family kinase protein